MRNLVIALLFLSFSSNLFANIDFFRGSWLCIDDHSLGFNWNRNLSKWEPKNYSTNKYIFKALSNDNCSISLEENQLCGEFYDFGDQPFFQWAYTYYPKNEYRNVSIIDGSYFGGKFTMSEDGEFIQSFNVPGPLGEGTTTSDGTQNYKDSMVLSVGSCSKI